MKFRIGYRTIKTAVGATLAILIAQSLGLENYASAGILTILCIKVTKKKSLRASWDRILACLIGMVFSFVFFELFVIILLSLAYYFYFLFLRLYCLRLMMVSPLVALLSCTFIQRVKLHLVLS